jgi:hypothetical protein
MIDLQALSQNKFIAITGRVQRWLDFPKKIYPVSCTVIDVEDSYFDIENDCSEYETICGSRTFVTKALKGNAGVAVDLTKLRPKGSVGSQGMIAQGCTNFMGMYSAINAEVRRGNSFKNGAVVLYLDVTHPDIADFLNFPKAEIPWAKRAIYIGSEIFEPKNEELKNLVIKKLALGDIFLAKRLFDGRGRRLKSNVCMEITIPSRGTCNLAHVNLGQIQSLDEIVPAFEQAMTFLCKLWRSINHKNSPYLDQERDAQVGLGVIGLANMLANFDVTYVDFVEALKFVLHPQSAIPKSDTALSIAQELFMSFFFAGRIAQSYGLDRAFTVAPTATAAFNHTDCNGYTTTPEISPPIAHPVTKKMSRVSEGDSREYQYPPNVEIAGHNVSFDTYLELAVCWQELMDIDGLAHAISFNVWTTGVTVDESFLRTWLESPLKSLYYRWAVSMESQDKTQLQGIEHTEEAENFWGDVDPDEDMTVMSACSLDGVCTECSG